MTATSSPVAVLAVGPRLLDAPIFDEYVELWGMIQFAVNIEKSPTLNECRSCGVGHSRAIPWSGICRKVSSRGLGIHEPRHFADVCHRMIPDFSFDIIGLSAGEHVDDFLMLVARISNSSFA